MPQNPRLVARLTAALGIAALAVGLAACTPDPVAEQYREGGDTGYIAGEQLIQEFPAAERGEPVAWEGVTEHGEKLSSEDLAGQVVVVNFWYATCAPCRVEAADLQKVYDEFKDDGVSFVGVNTFDQADQARSFAEEFGVTYPSIIDVDDATVKLAFAAATPISATPTTLVIDKQGRVAARILSMIESPSILSTLVKDALAEKA